jgi:hypothetical protein
MTTAHWPLMTYIVKSLYRLYWLGYLQVGEKALESDFLGLQLNTASY